MLYTIQPSGPFDLSVQRKFFGGWADYPDDPEAVLMAFPVEGHETSAAVALRQDSSGTVTGEVIGPAPERAWSQACASLSLDFDGSGYAEVGRRDPHIGAVQREYSYLRPVCFYSPYEAAAHFLISQRISMQQARKLRTALAERLGEELFVAGQSLRAFPAPHVLARLEDFPGLSLEKVERLRGMARAAQTGALDRERLRALPVPEALAQLGQLRGVGPFSAQGILHRGAGLVDDIPDDDVTPQAVQKAYSLAELPGRQQILELGEAWKPYRMWATVLLHVWLRREGGGPTRGSARKPNSHKE